MRGRGVRADRPPTPDGPKPAPGIRLKLGSLRLLAYNKGLGDRGVKSVAGSLLLHPLCNWRALERFHGDWNRILTAMAGRTSPVMAGRGPAMTVRRRHPFPVTVNPL